MAKFKIIKEINAGSGYLLDAKGNSVSMQQLVPKVGDVIEGVISEQYIYNQNLEGISYPISTGAKGQESSIFITSDSLQEVSDDTPTTNKLNWKWLLAGLGVITIGYLIMKKK